MTLYFDDRPVDEYVVLEVIIVYRSAKNIYPLKDPLRDEQLDTVLEDIRKLQLVPPAKNSLVVLNSGSVRFYWESVVGSTLHRTLHAKLSKRSQDVVWKSDRKLLPSLGIAYVKFYTLDNISALSTREDDRDSRTWFRRTPPRILVRSRQYLPSPSPNRRTQSPFSYSPTPHDQNNPSPDLQSRISHSMDKPLLSRLTNVPSDEDTNVEPISSSSTLPCAPTFLNSIRQSLAYGTRHSDSQTRTENRLSSEKHAMVSHPGSYTPSSAQPDTQQDACLRLIRINDKQPNLRSLHSRWEAQLDVDSWSKSQTIEVSGEGSEDMDLEDDISDQIEEAEKSEADEGTPICHGNDVAPPGPSREILMYEEVDDMNNSRLEEHLETKDTLAHEADVTPTRKRKRTYDSEPFAHLSESDPAFSRFTVVTERSSSSYAESDTSSKRTRIDPGPSPKVADAETIIRNLRQDLWNEQKATLEAKRAKLDVVNTLLEARADTDRAEETIKALKAGLGTLEEECKALAERNRRLDEEKQVAEQGRLTAEALLRDVRRECKEPFVVPALFDAFILISELRNGLGNWKQILDKLRLDGELSADAGSSSDDDES